MDLTNGGMRIKTFGRRRFRFSGRSPVIFRCNQRRSWRRRHSRCRGCRVASHFYTALATDGGVLVVHLRALGRVHLQARVCLEEQRGLPVPMQHGGGGTLHIAVESRGHELVVKGVKKQRQELLRWVRLSHLCLFWRDTRIKRGHDPFP